MTRSKQTPPSTDTLADQARTTDAAALAARTTGIDLETILKVKELCEWYGADTVKQMVAVAVPAERAA